MSVSLNSYNSIASSSSKLYVPVSKSALLYSHFEHVSGFVANKGQHGVSVSKIQILNTLIDHLSAVKSGKQPAAVKNASPEQIDAMIDNYQTQIRQAVKAAEVMPYAAAGARPEAGALFSLNA
ncbi:MAG: hypothetical protein K6F15_03110 [Treponema sp.]|nr:hypothetical protein [Treponema sp.]